ncbi:MerC domain-containing protein [Aquirufa sp. ROCK2-A2]
MSEKKQVKQLVTVERIGIFLSVVCAIHCMAMPLFIVFAPMLLSTFAFSGLMEWILVSSSFILAAILLFIDYRKHQKALPLILLLIALAIKLSEYLIHQSSIEWIFGILLGLSIGLAYWVNYQHKSTCTCKIKS